MDLDMTLLDAPGMEEISLAEMLDMDRPEDKNTALLLRQAEDGNLNAMYLLGYKYLRGKDVEQDVAEGLYWLAKSGESASFMEIAMFYEANADVQRAEQWYIRVVEKADQYEYMACFFLCRLFIGKETGQELKKIKIYLDKGLNALERNNEWFSEHPDLERGAKKDFSNVAYVLGMRYLKKDLNTGIQYMETAYSLNPENANIASNLSSTCKMVGLECLYRKIPFVAVTYLEKAMKYDLEGEDDSIVLKLSDAYAMILHLDEIPKDMLKKAFEYLEPMADVAGGAYEQAIYIYYYKRRGTLHKEFFQWAKRLADKGDIDAQLSLTMAYLGEKYDPKMKGFRTDLQKSKGYFDMATAGLKKKRTESAPDYEKLNKRYLAVKKDMDKADPVIEKRLNHQDAIGLLKEMKKAGSHTYRIPEGYTHIPSRLLLDVSGAEKIEEIVMPDSVRVVEEWAFAYIPNLQKIIFSANLEHLGGHAFDTDVYYTGLKRFRKKKPKFEKMMIPENAKLSPSTFYGIGEIGELIFADGYGEFDLSWMYELAVRNLYLPDSVQTYRNSQNKLKITGIDTLSVPQHLKDVVNREMSPNVRINNIEYRG